MMLLSSANFICVKIVGSGILFIQKVIVASCIRGFSFSYYYTD